MLTAIKTLMGGPLRHAERQRAKDRAEERTYWRQRLERMLREEYGVAMHPVQSDESLLPSGELVASIQQANKTGADVFFASGYRASILLLEDLRDHGFDPRSFERILDFGVGVGRLIRHFYAFAAELHGCDVTEPVVREVERQLGGRVRTNVLTTEPVLPYPDQYFDFVWANSVFTHIPHDKAAGWASELRRVVRPGGCLIVTAYGSNRYLGHLSERSFDEIQKLGVYEWGDRTVRDHHAYYTTTALRRFWSEYFDVLEIRDQFKDQDHVIMRRRAGESIG